MEPKTLLLQLILPSQLRVRTLPRQVIPPRLQLMVIKLPTELKPLTPLDLLTPPDLLKRIAPKSQLELDLLQALTLSYQRRLMPSLLRPMVKKLMSFTDLLSKKLTL